MYRPLSLLALAFCSCFVVAADPPPAEDRAAKWEKDIAALEKKQAEQAPAKGGIVFTGSSTIRMWDLAKSYPEWKAINSGFGGSEIRDVTMFADRIVLKHEPKTIVFYAGDNDVHSVRKPEQVAEDFRAFAETVHKRLPKTHIYFLSIKPSPIRAWEFEKQQVANEKVKAVCAKDDRLTYVDIVTKMLGEDHKPRSELFAKDGLHLSPEGYAVLDEAVRKAMK